MKVTAKTIPVNAVQNHSDPGPMKDIPLVLMTVMSEFLSCVTTL